MLRISQEILAIAVKATDDDGPLRGDLALLKVIAEGAAVIIPGDGKVTGQSA